MTTCASVRGCTVSGCADHEGDAQIQLKPDEHCMWPLKDYSEMEAREAYERVAKFHGWPTQRRYA